MPDTSDGPSIMSEEDLIDVIFGDGLSPEQRLDKLRTDIAEEENGGNVS